MASPSYTFATKTFSTAGSSNFGGLTNDANRNAMTGAVGAGIQTQDNTGTPITSPATVTTGTTLVVPLNAISLVLYTSAALRVSEVSSYASYFVVPTANSISIDVSRMANVYLKQDSGSCTVQFFFVVV